MMNKYKHIYAVFTAACFSVLMGLAAYAPAQDRAILYTLQPALQGGTVADGADIGLQQTYPGVVSGSVQVEQAIRRLDGTGVGSAIFRFTGNYAAQNSNISEWFGNRQLTRLRATSAGSMNPAVFTLPGTTALEAAFDTLSANGMPEVITFVIEYTGATDAFLSIQPRNGGPNIQGTTSIPVRSGIGAQVEITRTGGVISEYVFDSIGVIGDTSSGNFDTLKFIRPADAVWNAGNTASLPSVGVVKGNGYQVTNVPPGSDTVLDEVMRNGDYAVWTGETFTSWTQTPHQWFVMPAHEVRRITALERGFLAHTAISPISDRNTITRGADYADSASEILLKFYANLAAYSAADLNSTGDIDVFTDPSDTSGVLAVRLTGTQATLASVLPTLEAYVDHVDGSYTRLGNLHDDFTYQGDFGSESDYVSNSTFSYTGGDNVRIYVVSVEDRYQNLDLDVLESNLSASVQAKLNRTAGPGSVDEQRLANVESKVAALYPLTPDVTDLTEWSNIFEPERAAQEVSLSTGYSLVADYRGPSSRYESAGVTYSDTQTNAVTYTGLGENRYRAFGVKVPSPSDQVLVWLVEGTERIPYIDMTSAGNFRINNYTPSYIEDQEINNAPSFLTRTSGDEILTHGSGNVSTFTIPNFPANATRESARSIEVDINVLVSGSDTLAGHFQAVTLPLTNTAQTRQQFNASIDLGPLHNNRSVAVTMGYTLRVSGSNLLIDFTLLAAPSDVTVRLDDVTGYLSYTAPAAVARVDSWQVLNDASGDYTFAGEAELMVTFHPIGNTNLMQAVSVAVTGGAVDQLNDVNTPIPASFASVEVPDTTALSGFEFRTFSPEHYLVHSDLAHLIGQRSTQWAYGLALLRTTTEHAIGEPIDLAAGSTINGVAIATGGSLAANVVHQATALGTGSGELVSSIQLPATYANYDFVHITDVTPGSPNMWRHAAIPTAMLSSGDVGTNDNIRLPDAAVLTWNLATRTVSVSGGAQEIYRVVLIDN